MTEEIPIDDVMARRFELVEQQAIIGARHKAELKPIDEELSMCEMFIKDHMNKSGLQQIKTAAGETHFTTKSSVTVKDIDTSVRFIIGQAPCPAWLQPQQWVQALDHIYAHGLWAMLTKALNKTAVKEQLDAGKTPAELGVEYSSFKDLVWKRGKVA